MTLPLSGLFNVDNALVAAAVADDLGVDPDAVAAGLAAARRSRAGWRWWPPGRPFAVLVDYAHTPAGLEVALAAARRTGRSRAG